jgi:hypothetical protein
MGVVDTVADRQVAEVRARQLTDVVSVENALVATR